MGWNARLDLHYRREADRTVGAHHHVGPLRVLKALYPEGPGICHHVVVHPPAGIAAGDRLTLQGRLDPDAHVLLTTPGATRFYRCDGDTGVQDIHLTVGEGARLEWTPGETLVYDGAQAHNRMRFDLAPGARMIGWEVTALGLPAAGKPFLRGALHQRLSVVARDAGGYEVPWLEQGRLAADDHRLLESPLGLGGHRTLATMWLACGDVAPDDPLRAALLEARQRTLAVVDAWHGRWPLAGAAAGPQRPVGITLAMPHVLVLRALGERVEPLMQLLRAVRGAWREPLLGVPAADPRVWST